MNKRVFLIGVFILAAILPACSSYSGGPTTWIDQPLDDSYFPLAPITLQAHASDGDGVGGFHFLVDDTLLMAIGAGGGRLENAIIEWRPDMPGEYIIGIRAVDSGGNEGPLAISHVTILFPEAIEVASEAAEPSEFAPAEEIEEEEEEEPIQAAEEQAPEAVARQGINCRSGPGTEYSVSKVLQPNDPARIVGRLSNNTWILLAYPGSSVECWVAANIVTITGNLGDVSIAQAPPPPDSPPPEEPEPEPEEPPPSPPSDTTAPTIASVSVSPSSVYQDGCYGETTTATISVEAIDIGGIATVEAAWSSGSVKLTHAGGYTYTGTVGPFANKGTVTIHGSAVDTSGNWAPFIVTITVDCCIC